MTQPYYIVSKNTNFHSVTYNEEDGALVSTSDGDFNKNSILFFSHAVDGPGLVTITGPNGLYIALPEGGGNEAKLIWSKDKFEWVISVVVNVPKTYQIYPSNGNDLYWVDKFGIGQYIIVLEGKKIVPPESSWYLVEVK